ncbi:sigma-w pathway protein ysdB [Neobacillus ginsengisoli]|uniref:Sigma-w pathway protein ysdB n=1 Tax=Neobacillus ginsengisoli TaxID=904295 RepID=A0ABT9XNB8_9BACI|nr:sigma-w pathway protein ysdB [Neobacillus ginsengisoli]MDQ0197045.1 hypothetical protein [Neobacillus ginsengisoli]
MIWLLRIVLLSFIIFFFYFTLKPFFTSNRRFETARRQKRFLLLDNEDVRKNFLLTYKGVVFAGEKYLGATDDTFDVVSISIWPQNTSSLKGLVKEDFNFMEKKIHVHYPKAEIIWKIPVNELLQKN